MSKIDFEDQLRRQLGFLKNSCFHFDSGNVEEGVRLATTMRVMLYDGPNSKSLLTLMGKRNIRLRSSVKDFDNAIAMMGALSRIRIDFENPEQGDPKVAIAFVPSGEESVAQGRLISVDEWWNQVVYVVHGQRVSRGQIILHAANKDGGAHVEKSGFLPEMYSHINSNVGATIIGPKDENGRLLIGFTFNITGNDVSGNHEEWKGALYSDLRQMASELLLSEEVVNISA